MSQFYTTEKATYGALDFITIKSNALKKRADITAFDPTEKKATGVPLVILLHGVYGSHWAWAMQGKVHETAQKLINNSTIKPMILAMPSDGLFGDGSGYLPHNTANYEEWIVNDVIEVMKEQYPAINQDSPIFIAGLSMGGFGALRLGAKYPHIFKAFSGLSSITHFDQLAEFVADFQALKDTVLEQDGVIDWLIKNRETLPPFRFDCGRNDILIEHNRKLHQDLMDNDISHIYEEFSGEHSWKYWEENIGKSLEFFNALL